jgi:hypothetical protein
LTVDGDGVSATSDRPQDFTSQLFTVLVVEISARCPRPNTMRI